MNNYLKLCVTILTQGDLRKDRTGTGTLALFGQSLDFDLRDGFPLITTKKVNWTAIVNELLWMISGSTNVKDLDSKIWDEWADVNGDLGPVYGAQWAKQLPGVIDTLRKEPHGRRHIVDSWQVIDLPDMRLPPCHMLYQFYVNEYGLYCQMYQRSADMFLGVPFNIAAYSLLTHLVAATLGVKPIGLKIVFGDCHIYSNHMSQMREQITRQPRKLPTLEVIPQDDIRGYKPEHIILKNYSHDEPIKGKVSV